MISKNDGNLNLKLFVFNTPHLYNELMSAESDNGIFTIIPDNFEGQTDHALVPNTPAEAPDFNLTPYADRSNMVDPSAYKLEQEVPPVSSNPVNPPAQEMPKTPQTTYRQNGPAIETPKPRTVVEPLPTQPAGRVENLTGTQPVSNREKRVSQQPRREASTRNPVTITEGLIRVEIAPTTEQQECDKYCSAIRNELVTSILALAERDRSVKKVAEQNWGEITRRINLLPNEVVMLMRNSEHPSTFKPQVRQQQVWDVINDLVINNKYRIDTGLDGRATSLSVVKNPKTSNPTEIPKLPGWMNRNRATLPDVYGIPTQVKIDDENSEEVILFKKAKDGDTASGKETQKTALAQVDIFERASHTKNEIYFEYVKRRRTIPPQKLKEYDSLTVERFKLVDIETRFGFAKLIAKYYEDISINWRNSTQIWAERLTLYGKKLTDRNAQLLSQPPIETTPPHIPTIRNYASLAPAPRIPITRGPTPLVPTRQVPPIYIGDPRYIAGTPEYNNQFRRPESRLPQTDTESTNKPSTAPMSNGDMQTSQPTETINGNPGPKPTTSSGTPLGSNNIAYF